MLKTKAFRAIMATSVLTAASIAFADPQYILREPLNDNTPQKSREELRREAMQRLQRFMSTPPMQHEIEIITMLRLLQDSYLDADVANTVIKDAIKHIYSKLDPHTEAYNVNEMEAQRLHMSGEMIGIGVEISVHEKGIKIERPLDDSPAFRAGLHAGDIITHVDDKSLVDEYTPEEALKAVRGAPGTSVKITVERNGIQMPPFNIVRARFESGTIKSHMIDNIGYIKIPKFVQDKTADQFRRAVESFNNQAIKPTGLIIDLRFNGGGSLDDVVKIGDMLLDNDGIIVNQVGRTPENSEIHKATPGAITNLPVVVLVNRYSASASELLSVALQDHNRATIMGEGTYGKGTVQAFVPQFIQNWGMKYTIAQYLSPLNYIVQQNGVTPDILTKPIKPLPENPNFAFERDKPNVVKGGVPGITSPAPRISKEWCEASKKDFAPGELPFSMLNPLTEEPDVDIMCARDHLNRVAGINTRPVTINTPYTPPPKVEKTEGKMTPEDRKKLWTSPKRQP